MSDDRTTPDPLDTRSGAEAARLRAEAGSIAETESALAAVFEPPAPTVAIGRRPRRLLVGVVAGGIAAALAVVVAVAVVVERDATPGSPATEPVLSTTPQRTTPTAPPSTTSTATTTTTTTSPASASLPPGASTTTTTRPGDWADPTTVDMLAGWPAAPTDVVALDDLPRLLPAGGVPNTERVEGSEYSGGSDEGLIEYSQQWLVPGDDPVYVSIRTHTRLIVVDPVEPVRVTVPGWDAGYLPRSGEGFAQLNLEEPSGLVILWARGLSADDLVAIASTMVRRPGLPGWQPMLPEGSVPRAGGLRPLGEGWEIGGAGRTVDWYSADQRVAHVQIAAGQPNQFPGGVWDYEVPVQIVDVGGADALVIPVTQGARVAWSPAPDVTVTVGYAGSVDEAIAFARSLEPVDQRTWDAASGPSTAQEDDCGFFGC